MHFFLLLDLVLLGFYFSQGKFHFVYNAFSSGFVNMYFMAYLVFHYWSQIPYLYSKWVQVFCCPILSCVMTLVPGGAMGVLLKSKYPPNSISAESFGFDLAGIIRLNAIWACLKRRHHRCIGGE